MSTKQSKGGRLGASGRWEVTATELRVDKVPAQFTRVQLYWRRKKKQQSTLVVAVVGQGEERHAEWRGEALRFNTLVGSLCLSKNYEFVVKGGVEASNDLHTIGKATIDVARYCSWSAQSQGRHEQLVLPLKRLGVLRVGVPLH